MRVSDRIVIGLGTLDITYVAWTILGIVRGGPGLRSMSHNLINWGFPFPNLLIAFVVLVYVAITVCGVALVLRRRRFAWLNYVLLPFRIALVLPTLYPVFALLAVLRLALPPLIAFISMVVTELARCIFVFTWQRRWSSHSSIDDSVQAV
jgi:hypothetical protein